MDMLQYLNAQIIAECVPAVTILNLFGVWLKNVKVSNKLIPIIILFSSPIPTGVLIWISRAPSFDKDFVITAIAQGIICAAVAVFGNQLVKNTGQYIAIKKEEASDSNLSEEPKEELAVERTANDQLVEQEVDPMTNISQMLQEVKLKVDSLVEGHNQLCEGITESFASEGRAIATIKEDAEVIAQSAAGKAVTEMFNMLNSLANKRKAEQSVAGDE